MADGAGPMDLPEGAGSQALAGGSGAQVVPQTANGQALPVATYEIIRGIGTAVYFYCFRVRYSVAIYTAHLFLPNNSPVILHN